MNHVSVGCVYRSTGVGYQTIYGRVTDAQIFGKSLSQVEMKKITGCEGRMEGDILSWELTEWILAGVSKGIKTENLDFEENICYQRNTSYHLIPIQANFNPNSVEICQRFSSEVAIQNSSEQFEEILKYSGEEGCSC